VESWAQVCSGIAAVALLLSSGARFLLLRLGAEQRRSSENLLVWSWRACALVGVGGLFFSVVFRGVDGAALDSVAGRAAVVALVASLLSAARGLREPAHQGQPTTGWAGLILQAAVAGISAGRWSPEEPSAPLLVTCTLATAGLGLWAAGRRLDALALGQDVDRWAAGIAFAALALTVVVVAVVNWRVWGTPSGAAVVSPGLRDEFLNLLAVWLFSAASLVLGERWGRLADVLKLLAAALLVRTALTVQWTMPFM
jgi:hypothetical protein